MSNLNSGPEFSREIRTRPLPAEPVLLEANEAERAALSKRFGITRIDALTASVSLENTAKAVTAKGSLSAQIIQSCAVSGEDFPVSIDEKMNLRFVPPVTYSGDPDIEIELTPEELDEVEFTGDSFDLGEAVAQTLGLAIDPYAEGPNADDFRAKHDLSEGEKANPFAALAGLKKERD